MHCARASLAGLAGLVAVTGVVACNALLGIDDPQGEPGPGSGDGSTAVPEASSGEGAVNGDGAADSSSDAAPAPPCPFPIRAGLLNHWPFEADGADTAVIAYDLDLIKTVRLRSALIGNGLELDGDGFQGATRPVSDDVHDFPMGAFTMQVWAAFESLGDCQVLIEKFVDGTGPGWSLVKETDARVRFLAPPAVNIATRPLTSPPRAWNHVVVRRVVNTYELYVDGALATSAAAAVEMSPAARPLTIGRRDGNRCGMRGKIDEVAIWKRALSPSEIIAMYGAGRGCSLGP